MDKQNLTLLEHIAELRTRLFRVAIALLVGTLIGTLFSDDAIAILGRPMGETALIVLSPTEAPVIYFKVALFLGFVIALPYILYQVYAFIVPGLYPNERKFFLLAIPAVVVLFALGATFTLTILIPFSLPVLMGFLQGVVQPTYSLQEYLSFVTTLLFWMGLLFQTPLVLYALARVGVVRPDQLKKARKLIIFGAAVVAAVITPTTDPVTMLLVTGPFIVLYEIGLVLARLAQRQKKPA
jgi:sec-independent protein translocase protein TatC